MRSGLTNAIDCAAGRRLPYGYGYWSEAFE